MIESSNCDSNETPVTELQVSVDDLGKRLDVFLAELLPGTSRAQAKQLIKSGRVTVDAQTLKASAQLRPGQRVLIDQHNFQFAASADPVPEDIPLEILLEDDHIVAVNKPPGMVVHPAKGHWSGTLTAALAHHFRHLSSVGGAERPGIIHRLDRDTSGVILIAKTNAAHLKLAREFEKRSIEKKYLAVVSPAPDRDADQIQAPIGPHPYQREKMAIRPDSAKAKPAQTFFEVVERRGRFAILHVFPKTGRTHQIRLHLAHIHSPILADRLYGGRSSVTAGWITNGRDDDQVVIGRQALHAISITFSHPSNGQQMTVSAPLPDDLEKLIAGIRALKP